METYVRCGGTHDKCSGDIYTFLNTKKTDEAGFLNFTNYIFPSLHKCCSAGYQIGSCLWSIASPFTKVCSVYYIDWKCPVLVGQLTELGSHLRYRDMRAKTVSSTLSRHACQDSLSLNHAVVRCRLLCCLLGLPSAPDTHSRCRLRRLPTCMLGAGREGKVILRGNCPWGRHVYLKSAVRVKHIEGGER